MKDKRLVIVSILAIVSALLIANNVSFAQKGKQVFNAGDFFVENEVIWYGLDFSNARMVGEFSAIGEFGDQTATQIRDNHYTAWNYLILNEPKNFNLQRAFKKKQIVNDLSVVTSRNSKINPENIFGKQAKKLTAETIEKVIAGYKDTERKSGLGLVFIVDYFCKHSMSASVNVVAFDVSSRKVLFSERVSGKPRGFGLRNYWAGAIKEIIKSIQTRDYKLWEKKYKQ